MYRSQRCQRKISSLCHWGVEDEQVFSKQKSDWGGSTQNEYQVQGAKGLREGCSRGNTIQGS